MILNTRVLVRANSELGKRASWSPLIRAIAHQREWADLAERLTVVCDIRDLRKMGAPIGRSTTSWERLYDEVVRSVLAPGLGLVSIEDRALRFRQLVIRVGLNGAVVVRGSKGEQSELVYDPLGQERDRERMFPGWMIGYNTCLVAAIATGWAECRNCGDTRDLDFAARLKSALKWLVCFMKSVLSWTIGTRETVN